MLPCIYETEMHIIDLGRVYFFYIYIQNQSCEAKLFIVINCMIRFMQEHSIVTKKEISLLVFLRIYSISLYFQGVINLFKHNHVLSGPEPRLLTLYRQPDFYLCLVQQMELSLGEALPPLNWAVAC